MDESVGVWHRFRNMPQQVCLVEWWAVIKILGASCIETRSYAPTASACSGQIDEARTAEARLCKGSSAHLVQRHRHVGLLIGP